MREEPHVVFQDVRGFADDESYARIALSPVKGAEKVTTSLECERVYFRPVAASA